MRRAGFVAVVTAVLMLTACSPTQPQPSSAPPPTTDPATAPATVAPTEAPPTPSALVPTGDPETIATGLEAPWDIAFAHGVALISERDSAVIREVADDGTMRVIATIDGVVHGGEGGLLGLAVEGADGAETALFVYSTGKSGNRVQRFELQGSPGSFTLGASTMIIDSIPAARNHNGGRLAIGPDGYFYIATGDASDTESAQDPSSLGGKILRVQTDGTIPSDNPDPTSPVYSLGHRNVQGIAWAQDGTMYASEFGQDTWDELNIIVAGGNYGWPEHEGVGAPAGMIDPVQVWTTSDASPSGVAVVGGTSFIANLRGRVLRVIPTSDPGSASDYFAGDFGRLRDVERAPDGSLWVITNNTDGRGDPVDGDDRILRIELANQ